MKKQIVFLVLAVFAISLACQVFAPPTVTTREGTVISDCAETVSAMTDIQPGKIPQVLLETGVKQGGEFNVNDYFKVLTHLSMQKGYSLDYIYQVDGLGAYPLLYALPDGQTPYASTADMPENAELGDFREHLEIEDMEQGYFEAVVMQIMGRQFYLNWHANYNDAEIVCNQEAADVIVEGINAGDFGMKMDAKQKAQARAMTNIEPAVTLTGDSAIVEVVIFTKWGGFFRQTYTISRAFPHKMEMKEENLVEYDCGIMF
jgi:hypothetical protein